MPQNHEIRYEVRTGLDQPFVGLNDSQRTNPQRRFVPRDIPLAELADSPIITDHTVKQLTPGGHLEASIAANLQIVHVDNSHSRNSSAS